MSSVAALKERELNKRGVVQSVGTDTTVPIRIRHIGPTAVTSVVVNAGTSIVLTDAAATSTLLVATYGTVGAMVNAINGTGTWEAKILDALTTDACTGNYFKTSGGSMAATLDGKGNQVYNIYASTSVSKAMTLCLSPFRDFDSPRGHRVHLQEIVYYLTLAGAGAGLFNIYSRGAYASVSPGTTESKIFSDTSVNTTKTSYTFSNGFGDITGKDDQELIVQVTDGTMADQTTDYLRLTGIIE
jgi:hypothetical protein